MKGLQWAATTATLLATPASAAGRSGEKISSSGPLARSLSSATWPEQHPRVYSTVDLGRLRGGILGVGLVHEIAKTFLTPGGRKKSSGEGGDGGRGSAATVGTISDGAASGSRREDGKRATGDSSASAKSGVGDSNKNNSRSKSRCTRKSQGEHMRGSFKAPETSLSRRDSHRSNSPFCKETPRRSGTTRTEADSNSERYGSPYYPGRWRAAHRSGPERTEPNRAPDRGENRCGYGEGEVVGAREEEAATLDERIEMVLDELREAIANAESEVAKIAEIENRADTPEFPREQHEHQQTPVGSRTLSSPPSSGPGVPEFRSDRNGGAEQDERSSGSRNGNGRSGANGFADGGQVENNLDTSEYSGGVDSTGGRGSRDTESDESDDVTRAVLSTARAKAVAVLAREEVAALQEVVKANEQGAQGARVLPPFLQHVRAVLTVGMPFRFADELGAHIASALAICVFKGVSHAIMARRREKQAEKVLFSDVLGCDEAKEEVKQIVDFLVDPSPYDALGAKKPKGVLLVGPPGTGKTLIAKACAGEAQVPFLSACGSEFNGMYAGVGVAAVKRLFAKARRHKKSIIYIDEIDYLGRSRKGGERVVSGVTQDREATLNQLLSEMDGFGSKDGIVIMASTNRKEILDEALLRSGRFDMQVDVERPDRTGREQLFSKHLGSLKLAEGNATTAVPDDTSSNTTTAWSRICRPWSGPSAATVAVTEKEKENKAKREALVDKLAKELADLTPYMTGADVANVCATAGRIAARAGASIVSLQHFSTAVDRVCHGLEKADKIFSEDDRRRTAVHEAGHAVSGWMLSNCDIIVKVSIVWRGSSLGFSQSAKTERLSETKESILDNVCMALAGRAAEEVVFGTVSGGASSDLKAASRSLYSAITEIGFGDTMGLLSPGDRLTSEKVMADIDQDVKKILAEQYERALSLIHRYRGKIDRLADTLLDKGVVHQKDLAVLLGEKVTHESAVPAAPTPPGSNHGSPDSPGVPASGEGSLAVGEEIGRENRSVPVGRAPVSDGDVYCDMDDDRIVKPKDKSPAEYFYTHLGQRIRFCVSRLYWWRQPAL